MSVAAVTLTYAVTGGQPTAGAPKIAVGPDRLVHADPEGRPLVEPHLAIDPTNPRSMLAGVMIAKADGTYGLAAFGSADTGATWRRHDFPVTDGGDAWGTFLDGGSAVMAMLSGDRSELQVYPSADGGQTWAAQPWTIGTGQDHPTLIFDRDSAKYRGTLYAVSAGAAAELTGKRRQAIRVRRTTDGGASFEAAVHVIASNLAYEPHNPALMKDGTLLVPFADYRRPDTRVRLDRQRDWLVASGDGGRTFSEPMLISESCSGAGGWSSLATGPALRGAAERVYHVCAARGFDGIVVRWSDTAGDVWSDEIRVDRAVNVTPYTRTPAIAVNTAGVVGVAWYDGRADRSTIKGVLRCQEIYFAASVDGGVTFLPEVKISTEPSCPGTPQNITTALRFPAGGEYMGLAAAPDGTFHLVWSDSRSGVYQLRGASARVER